MNEHCLREWARLKFRNMFSEMREPSRSQSMLLVTDEGSLKILSNAMKMMELINFGISAIEKLSLKRKRFHKIDAIYLLVDCPESLERLLNDYPSEEEAQYGVVHIFYTSRVSA